MADQYQGLQVDEEQREKDRLEREMVNARRRAASQYRQGIDDTRTAMNRGNMLTRQYAAGNLGRAAGFTPAGGAALRAGLGAGMQAAGQIAEAEQTGVARLADMGANLGQLEESAAQGARDLMKSDQRTLKMQSYIDTYNKVYDAQGHDEAKVTIANMLVNETDPVVIQQINQYVADMEGQQSGLSKFFSLLGF